MYHTTIRPFTRRQQRRVARILALALLPLLWLTMTNHAPPSLPPTPPLVAAVRTRVRWRCQRVPTPRHHTRRVSWRGLRRSLLPVVCQMSLLLLLLLAAHLPTSSNTPANVPFSPKPGWQHGLASSKRASAAGRIITQRAIGNA